MKIKKLLTVGSLFVLSAVSATPAVAQDWGRLITGGIELIQSYNVSDEQIKGYVSQYVAQSDQTNKLAPAGSDYTTRLNRITSGIKSVDGQPLNFKVYITKDINAFACADGSVRVYSGLMDAMTDDEVLGVIGHEIGHVAHQDTKNAMKKALKTAAFKDILASSSSTIAVLTDSQLGALGEAIVNAKYSQKQESNADAYAYDFLKSHGKNPLVMCMAFEKLEQLSGNSSTSSLVSNLFSTHPETQKRIADLEKRAKKDGYVYPSKTTTTTAATKTADTKSTASKTTAKKSTSKSTASKSTATKKSTSKSTSKSGSSKSKSKK